MRILSKNDFTIKLYSSVYIYIYSICMCVCIKYKLVTNNCINNLTFFRNKKKCGPFGGAINKFSLDTEKLIEKYKDVELQLIFLQMEVKKYLLSRCLTT